jgi:bacterioferritin
MAAAIPSASGETRRGPSVGGRRAQHAKEEETHLDWLTARINQPGGRPNMNPEGLAARAASQYANDMHDLLVDHEGRPMLKK